MNTLLAEKKDPVMTALKQSSVRSCIRSQRKMGTYGISLHMVWHRIVPLQIRLHLFVPVRG